MSATELLTLFVIGVSLFVWMCVVVRGEETR